MLCYDNNFFFNSNHQHWLAFPDINFSNIYKALDLLDTFI